MPLISIPKTFCQVQKLFYLRTFKPWKNWILSLTYVASLKDEQENFTRNKIVYLRICKDEYNYEIF